MHEKSSFTIILNVREFIETDTAHGKVVLHY